jgi:Tfp pilus assembly protein PilN
VAIRVNLLPREARAARPGRAVTVPSIGVGIGAGLFTRVLAGALVTMVLVLGFLGYRAWSAKGQHQAKIATLKVQNEQLKAQLIELRQAEEAKREIQRRIEVIGKVAKSQGVPLAMLNGVLRAVPQGVWLSNVEMKPQEVKVKVDAAPPASAASETLGRLEAKRAEVTQTPPAGGARQASPTQEVTQLAGYSVVIRGAAFNNFQIADFMDNLRKNILFADVDFVVTQADRVEQTRIMSFEVTAMVKP